jgi:hypothetical protein
MKKMCICHERRELPVTVFRQILTARFAADAEITSSSGVFRGRFRKRMIMALNEIVLLFPRQRFKIDQHLTVHSRRIQEKQCTKIFNAL